MTEQELIRRYFKTPKGKGVLVGVGDDAALVESDKKIVMSMDSLVVDRHFRKNDAPCDVGYKALAVNLSDLAAVGAAPRWALLSLSLSEGLDEAWVGDFAAGFLSLADQWQVSLIGGDLVRGPLVITVQISGEVDKKGSLLRSGARENDGIYMTGSVGNAGFAWHRADQLPTDDRAAKLCSDSLRRPIPRVREGRILAPYATAAIDVSDGLLLDLSRLLEASDKGGVLDLDDVVIGAGVSTLLREEDWLLPLTAGDDYELLFTLPDEHEAEVHKAITDCGTRLTRIGRITKRSGLRCFKQGVEIPLPEVLGFDHFGKSVGL